MVRGMNCPVNGPPLHSHLPHIGKRRMLVEHYGLGVLVCHLGHMTEDIFFCNNTKEAPTKRETERGREIYYVHLTSVERTAIFFCFQILQEGPNEKHFL